MKYIKRFKINEMEESVYQTLDSLSDEELQEKLKWLYIERTEINEEIESIQKIVKSRKPYVRRRVTPL